MPQAKPMTATKSGTNFLMKLSESPLKYKPILASCGIQSWRILIASKALRIGKSRAGTRAIVLDFPNLPVRGNPLATATYKLGV